MSHQAVLLAGLAAVLLWPTPSLLASARWPLANPVPALMLWQAIGLAAGLAAVGAGAVYAFGALGDSLPEALLSLWRDPSGLRALGTGRWIALVASAGLAAHLLSIAAVTTVRTLRTRQRHRQLLDLAATPLPVVRQGRLLDSATPMAYCLPGLRPRLVVTSATLTALSAQQLRAVLGHERAHLAQRHDLVVLPFVAWSAALPFLPGTRQARAAVALLIEMLADDAARAEVGAEPLAGALTGVGEAVLPAGAFGTGGEHALRLRLLRLSAPPGSAGRSASALGWIVAAVAVALIAVPTAMLLA